MIACLQAGILVIKISMLWEQTAVNLSKRKDWHANSATFSVSHTNTFFVFLSWGEVEGFLFQHGTNSFSHKSQIFDRGKKKLKHKSDRWTWIRCGLLCMDLSLRGRMKRIRVIRRDWLQFVLTEVYSTVNFALTICLRADKKRQFTISQSRLRIQTTQITLYHVFNPSITLSAVRKSN